MTDRYVIVYQDGSMSPLYDATECAYRLRLIKSAAWPVRPPRPAYRIRIREKDAKTQLVEQAQRWGFYDLPGIGTGGVHESTYRPDPFNNLPMGWFRS
jgi:hypothetical protein